jgi:hypothetical protein
MTDCNGCDTPATPDPLHADSDGEMFAESWRYDSIIGMLMYLASNIYTILVGHMRMLSNVFYGI